LNLVEEPTFRTAFDANRRERALLVPDAAWPYKR